MTDFKEVSPLVTGGGFDFYGAPTAMKSRAAFDMTCLRTSKGWNRLDAIRKFYARSSFEWDGNQHRQGCEGVP